MESDHETPHSSSDASSAEEAKSRFLESLGLGEDALHGDASQTPPPESEEVALSSQADDMELPGYSGGRVQARVSGKPIKVEVSRTPVGNAAPSDEGAPDPLGDESHPAVSPESAKPAEPAEPEGGLQDERGDGKEPGGDEEPGDDILQLACPKCHGELVLRREHVGVEGHCVWCEVPIVAAQSGADGEVRIFPVFRPGAADDAPPAGEGSTLREEPSLREEPVPQEETGTLPAESSPQWSGEPVADGDAEDGGPPEAEGFTAPGAAPRDEAFAFEGDPAPTTEEDGIPLSEVEAAGVDRAGDEEAPSFGGFSPSTSAATSEAGGFLDMEAFESVSADSSPSHFEPPVESAGDDATEEKTDEQASPWNFPPAQEGESPPSPLMGNTPQAFGAMGSAGAPQEEHTGFGAFLSSATPHHAPDESGGANEETSLSEPPPSAGFSDPMAGFGAPASPAGTPEEGPTSESQPERPPEPQETSGWLGLAPGEGEGEAMVPGVPEPSSDVDGSDSWAGMWNGAVDAPAADPFPGSGEPESSVAGSLWDSAPPSSPEMTSEFTDPSHGAGFEPFSGPAPNASTEDAPPLSPASGGFGVPGTLSDNAFGGSPDAPPAAPDSAAPSAMFPGSQPGAETPPPGSAVSSSGSWGDSPPLAAPGGSSGEEAPPPLSDAESGGSAASSGPESVFGAGAPGGPSPFASSFGESPMSGTQPRGGESGPPPLPFEEGGAPGEESPAESSSAPPASAPAQAQESPTVTSQRLGERTRQPGSKRGMTILLVVLTGFVCGAALASFVLPVDEYVSAGQAFMQNLFSPSNPTDFEAPAAGAASPAAAVPSTSPPAQ